jgi:hypothetical protein
MTLQRKLHGWSEAKGDLSSRKTLKINMGGDNSLVEVQTLGGGQWWPQKVIPCFSKFALIPDAGNFCTLEGTAEKLHRAIYMTYRNTMTVVCVGFYFGIFSITTTDLLCVATFIVMTVIICSCIQYGNWMIIRGYIQSDEKCVICNYIKYKLIIICRYIQ